MAAVTTAKAQFYHASGYIKAIGKNARRTIYHPNPRIKHRWQRDLKYLIGVRDRAYSVLHPAPLWPAHHSLWLCIQGYEGPWNDTSPPYTGGLQMHLNWYGLANAGYASQLQQEWTAERAYAAHSYSRSFLESEWFNWDNADSCA